jgi:bla regulator protein blaR1
MKRRELRRGDLSRITFDLRFFSAFALIGLLVGISPVAQAQQNAQFEVASVREHPFAPGSIVGVEFRPGGKMIATDAPIQLLIMSAYRLQLRQIRFAPGVEPLKSPYDIEAIADPNIIRSGGPTRESIQQMELMLRSLLADRFKLTIHTEKQELPVYVLRVGKSGLKLQKAPVRDCSASPSPCRWLKARPSSGFLGQSVTLQGLAERLSFYQDRIVLNQTGIDGTFDIDLPAFSRGATAGTVVDGEPADLNAPSLSTVLQEIGLRFEPGKQMLDVLVVDHLEKPSPN